LRSPAVNPNVGGVPGTVVGGSGTVPGTATSSPITGQRKGCIYKNQIYYKDAEWEDGCDLRCKCIDDMTGYYTCTEKCQSFTNLPPQCRLIPDPNDASGCCKTYVCDVQVTTTPVPINQGGVATAQPGSNYCVYGGRYYRQGEEWEDGCSLKCRCEDALNQYHQCSQRCPAYNNVPVGCRMVTDPNDPTCCKMPECDSVTGPDGAKTPLGFYGTYNSNGRPSGSQVSNTGYRNACIYKGAIYQQGAVWQDGCELDCECTNAAQGVYRCSARCQRFAALPSGCNLVQDSNDQCCLKAECAPPSSSMCKDNLANCYLYDKATSCTGSYAAWAKDNCAYYCGFCAGQTTQAPANCNDILPNCADYGTDGCVGTYESWARYNCPKTCNYCGGNGPATQSSGAIVVTGQPGVNMGTGACVDKLSTCSQYGPESCNDPYRNWAIDNCPAHCNLCSLVGTNQIVTGSGSQVITGSTLGCFYKGQLYQQNANWMDGCEYNCTCVNSQTGFYKCGARCMTYSSLPAGCNLQQEPNGGCCKVPYCNGVPYTGNTQGCLYKGALHPAGSTWNDGCDYKCQCLDGQTGQYQCTARCPTWNLPQACSLTQPAAGKCCPTPNCPNGYNINYPPGYTAE